MYAEDEEIFREVDVLKDLAIKSQQIKASISIKLLKHKLNEYLSYKIAL